MADVEMKVKVHAQFLTTGIADPLGAIAAANEGLVPVENLEYSCHATKLLLQRLGVFCQHFEQICRSWHGATRAPG